MRRIGLPPSISNRQTKKILHGRVFRDLEEAFGIWKMAPLTAKNVDGNSIRSLASNLSFNCGEAEFASCMAPQRNVAATRAAQMEPLGCGVCPAHGVMKKHCSHKGHMAPRNVAAVRGANRNIASNTALLYCGLALRRSPDVLMVTYKISDNKSCTNVMRTHPYAYPQHVKVVKRLLCV